jgi:CheY-like chemotaxis protein
MSFRALLVSKDDQAVETLTPVLSNFGLTVHRCLYPDALCLVSEQKFHAVLVDFDDPHSATLTFENLSAARFRGSFSRSVQSAKRIRSRRKLRSLQACCR